MNPLTRYPVLASLLRPFRLSQQKTCAALVAALCQAAQVSSFAIAGQLSCLTDVQFGSALTRLYRVSPITTVDESNHSTFASATFKFSFSRSNSYGVLPPSALCG